MADKDSSDPPPAAANPAPEEELDEDTKMAIALQKQMLEEFSAGGGDLGAVGMAKSLIEALSKDFSGIVAQPSQPSPQPPQPIQSPNPSLSSPPIPHVIPPGFFGDSGEDAMNPPASSPAPPPPQPQISPQLPFQTPPPPSFQQPISPSIPPSFVYQPSSGLSTPPPASINPFVTPPNHPPPTPAPAPFPGYSPVGSIVVDDDSDDSDEEMDLASLKQLQQKSIHSIFTKEEAKVDNSEKKKPEKPVEEKPVEEKKKQDENDVDSDDSDDDMDLASLKQLQQKSIRTIFTKDEEKGDAEMKKPEEEKKKKEEKQEVANSPQPDPSQVEKPEPPKQCLICHSKITQYVVFPGCKSPHTYCVPCAQTLLTAPKPRSSSVYRPQKPHNPNKIRCAFCQLETPIDDRGIAPFKRRCRRPRGCFTTGKCDIHKDEYVLYFCFECYVAVCVHCAPEHSGHQFAILEDAMASSKRTLSQSINRLADNQMNLVNYRESVIAEKKKVIDSAQTRRNELTSQIAQLKKLLNNAEAKLATGIDQMEKTRLDQLSSELKWVDDKEKLTEKSIASSSALACMEEPLPFFKLLEGCENVVKDAEAVVPPKKPTPLSQFPPLPTQQIIRGLQNVSYHAGGAYNAGGSYGAFNYDYQDGEEDEDEDEDDYDYF